MDQGRLQSWTDTIRNGGTPQFSGGFTSPKPPNMIGRAAPPFRLRGLDGSEHTLQEFFGKVVLLDFWTTWCAPCREEMPLLDRIHRDGKDVVVVAIDAGEDAETVSSFISKNKYTMPILLSGMSEAVASYRVSAYPTVVVIDKAGKVADYLIGGRGDAALNDAIAKGRAGAPPPPPSIAIREQATTEDLYRLAARFRREHNLDDCIAAMNRAVTLRPQWWMAHMMRADCHYDLKEYDEAIRDFDEVIRLRPEWASAYIRRGLAYSYSQRHPRSIEDYTAAIKLAPDNPQPFNVRGWAYLELGQLDRSLADLNEAVRLNPAFQLALENRTKLYMARK